MKRIGFIGGYDKTDLILNIAKILTVLENRVLVIDATVSQKARYVVPVINPTTMYVTEYEEIDIAVGFHHEDDIKKYLGIAEDLDSEYDIVLVDTDNSEGFQEFYLEGANKNYFVTSFDVYSLKRGLEALTGIGSAITLTKVLFSKEMLKEEDDYLNFLSLGYKVIWDENRIYFPVENGDMSVIYENQRVANIKFKKLSIQYKDGLAYIAEEILGDTSDSKVRRAIKTIEKGA